MTYLTVRSGWRSQRAVARLSARLDFAFPCPTCVVAEQFTKKTCADATVLRGRFFCVNTLALLCCYCCCSIAVIVVVVVESTRCHDVHARVPRNTWRQQERFSLMLFQLQEMPDQLLYKEGVTGRAKCSYVGTLQYCSCSADSCSADSWGPGIGFGYLRF